MSHVKPQIPKRLAAKVRKAQDTLQSCILRYIWDEKDVLELTGEIEAYQVEPDVWAEWHHPGCGGANSYPARTRIERTRFDLAKKVDRRPSVAEDLRSAELNLMLIEEEVLRTVSVMRDSPGRVPWPSPVIDKEIQYRQLLEQAAAWRNENAAVKQQIREERAQEEAREAAEERRRDLEDAKEMVAKGPAHVIRQSILDQELRRALVKYQSTEVYKRKEREGFGGGLIAFTQSRRFRIATAKAALQAKLIIFKSAITGKDLWETCSALGFCTPSTLVKRTSKD